MVSWQWIVIALVALASLGRMAAAVVGLFSRRAEATAVVRELPSVEAGRFTALEFPLRFVRDVSVGKGWSAGGLDVVLLPYRPMVDKMAARRAVSFFGPDETTHEVRFALHMTSEAAAQELVELIHALNVASSPSSERLRS